MTQWVRVLAPLAVAVLTACYPPVTSRPVGTTVGLRPDPALRGDWKGVNESGEPGYFHFLFQSDGTITAVIVASGPKAEDWNVATLTTAKLGANRIMNARLVLSNGKEENAPAGTVPVLYRIDPHGTLTLALMDEAKVKRAIADGKINGEVEGGAAGDATIAGDAKALDSFFASPDAARLFDRPFFTLHKVN